MDDDHQDWPAWCLNNFVQTHIHKGISDPLVLAKIKEKLVRLTALLLSSLRTFSAIVSPSILGILTSHMISLIAGSALSLTRPYLLRLTTGAD